MKQASVKKTARPSKEDLVDTLRARGFAYDLVKCLFVKEPAKTSLKRLLEDGLLSAFPLCGADEDLKETVDALSEYLKQPEAMSDTEIQKRNWDYTRLFVGPGEVPAPPWESLYGDAERLFFSKETLAVRKAYRKYDLIPRRLGQDPDDHVALELEFMQRLCEVAMRKLESTDPPGMSEILEDQRAFLEDHLLKWVPKWSEDVVKHAATDFYKGAARLLVAWLKLDRQLIEELIAAQ